MRRPALTLLLVVATACTTAATTTTAGTPSTTAGPPTTAAASTTSSAAVEGTTAEKLEAQGGEACPDSDFTCITIAMPLDHFHPDDGRTIDVVFAVHPATGGSPRGVLVFATGGPGASGIAVADSYLATYAEDIAVEFDVVFFDQRGLALSGGIACPDAAVAFYRIDALMSTPTQEQEYADAAATFVADCLAEAGDPPELPYLGTAQAVEDLEQFRTMMDYGKLILHGESYGTEYVQVYASAHPEAVERIVLDGTVDTTLEGLEFDATYAAGSARVLDQAFAACQEDEACAADMNDEPGVVYDRLAALLAEGPTTVPFPLLDGTFSDRSFGRGDLEVVAGGQVFTEEDRMLLDRALAAYGRSQDLVPLLRLAYVNLGIDPFDQTVYHDPTWSDAIQYGVDCLGFEYPAGTSEEIAEQILRAADSFDHARLGSFAALGLPCAFWPQAGTGVTGPLADSGVPTLVLVAEADPITTVEQGRAVAERLQQGHLIVQEGGPHVIFGYGNECPDDQVNAFVLDGTLPEEGTVCDGVLMTDYVPLLPESVSEFDTAGEMLDAIEVELNYLPEYIEWDGVSEDGVGCSGGGAIGFSSDETSYLFDFQECGLTEGLVIDGTGSYDPENDVFDLDVTIGDPSCHYAYTRSGDFASFDDDCAAAPFGG